MNRLDEQTRRGLAEAADVVMHGPERLRSLIIEASRNGARPTDIHRVVFPAYTYEYIARLIRADKAAQAAELEKCA